MAVVDHTGTTRSPTEHRSPTTVVSLVAGLLLLSAACASAPDAATDSGSSATRIEPVIEIVQLTDVPAAARHIEGSIALRYAVKISNPLDETITLQRIDVQSVGAGAYSLAPTGQGFDRTIEPHHFETVTFWASAFVTETVLGANGPVTLRVITQFKKASGRFQQVAVQQVHEAIGSAAH